MSWGDAVNGFLISLRSPKFLGGVFITAVLVLLLPVVYPSACQWLGIEELAHSSRWIWALAFVVSGSFLITEATAYAWKQYQTASQVKRERRERKERKETEEQERAEREERQRQEMMIAIASLDEAEKAVLREFWIQKRNTIVMPINDPPVIGLFNK